MKIHTTLYQHINILWLEDLYIKLIVLFPLTTLFQGYISSLNRLVFVALFMVQIVLFFGRKVTKFNFALLAVTAVLEIIAMVRTGWPVHSLNDVFYFPFMVIFLEYFISNTDDFHKALNRNRSFMKIVVYVWTVLVFISVFFPSSYYQKSYWGSDFYFKSFTDSTFRLSPAALFVLSMVLYIMVAEKNKPFILFSAIPMFCFVAGGARTYFAVGVMLFVIVWYQFFEQKKVFWWSMIPLAAVGLIVVSQTSILDKFIAMFNTERSLEEFLYYFTSSRNVFWKYDFDSFMALPLWEQMIGKGFNYVYILNKAAVNTAIWAHNDFLQMMLTYGWLGLGVYVIYLARVLKIAFAYTGKKEWHIFAAVIFIWLFNAFFNMFYTYFCAMLCFPIMVAALKKDPNLGIKTFHNPILKAIQNFGCGVKEK